MKGRVPLNLETWPRVASGMAMGVGALVLVGWAIGNEFLKRILPGFVAMNPTTAMCFFAAGLALWLVLRQERSRTLKGMAKALAVLVFSVGTLKLIGLAADWPVAVDGFLFASKLSSGRDLLPNRMAPNTALNFILIGFSLLTLPRSARTQFAWSQVAVILAAFNALLPLTGYFYGVNEFRGWSHFIPMALHTAVTFLVLASGLFFAAPTRLTKIFASSGSSGVLMRRLLPAVVSATLLLGWLRLWGEEHGLYASALGTALFAMALIVILVSLIQWAVAAVVKLEEQRAAAITRLQEANRRKDEMIAVVSHDLCSPLTGIQMVLDLLRQDRRETPDEMLNLMDLSTRRMVSMVRGLLDAAKLSSDQVDLERDEVLVSDIVRQSMEPLEINANAKRITMDLCVGEGETVIQADPLRLSQIFNNLLSNAVKFTAPGGSVVTRLDALPNGVRVVITDTGLGIARTDLPHIFDRYFQSSTKPTAGEKGLGLGLAIVRDLVALHGGRIQVESELNSGTTFTVHLPTGSAPEDLGALAPARNGFSREEAA